MLSFLMKLQVLVAAMHQKDASLIKEMGIATDAIIGNQTDQNSIEYLTVKDKTIQYLNFKERGVGLNRNNALMRADADIVLFADADERLENGYEKIVNDAYRDIPEADVIIFNLGTKGDNMGRREEKKIKRLKFWNVFNYGAPRISVKYKVLKRENIYFSLLFGGGAVYSAGEDTLFLYDLYKAGLKIYIYPRTIGTVSQDESSWFVGYNEKFFFDKGAFFAAINKYWGIMLCVALLIKNRRIWFGNDITLRDGIRLAYAGFKGYKKLAVYSSSKNDHA